MGIKYLYVKELAPTKEIRQKQKDADKLNNETKKQRTSLGYVFVSVCTIRLENRCDGIFCI